MCPKEISAIGAGTYRDMKYPVGSYMIQSNNPNQYRSVYVMPGSGPQDELEVYDTPQDVAFDIPAHYIPLPYMCSGTGHAVYRRHLYCHQHGTNLIVKFHLKRYDIIADLPLPGAGYSNTFPYTSGENTDIDLAVDELGVWAIYATNDSAGKIVITKIDHKHMELGKTWMTSYPKRSLGNAFMICGTLYATDSHRDVPTFIRYVFNTDTGEEQLLQPGEMPFLNSALVGRPDVFTHARKVAKGEGGHRKIRATRKSRGRRRERQKENGSKREVRESTREKTVAARESNSVMLSYDFRTSNLLSWNNGRLETFPIYFRDDA
ncbi:noelin [Elysia marginata]|uniref:Noelin n=1 Tax=Elysia marginata TaxID=1093978 RepID=A0AAV4JPL2_9GAST|nr:noelin [Elysia marginata]